MNADNLINRLVRSRGISLLVAALFLLCGHQANADPVGDFFKKLGQSISKTFQPQPTPRPTRKTIRPEATPTSLGEPSKPAKEEITRTVLPASAAPADKAKGDMPYGIHVPGRKGMVTSPYLPEANYIDVSAFVAGSAVKDPYTGKIFRVP
ncbi:MAG: hypothetical protein DMF10_09670 [Verrucomicrobia bacterium]|nr:MAG: hypothetical protein DMF10_09670 [Verrucomicrobiota bacterium]